MAKRNQFHRKPLSQRASDAFHAVVESIEGVFRRVGDGIGNVVSFFGALLFPKSLAKRLERATSATGASVGKRVGALTEHVEEKFSRGATGIFSWLGFLLQILVPRPLINWFSARNKAIRHWLGTRLGRLGAWLGGMAERYLPKWLVNSAKAASQWYRRTWHASSDFTAAWWKSRDFTALAWATPVFLLAVPVSFVLAIATAQSPATKIGHYQSSLYAALENKDFSTVELFKLKLSQLGYRRMERVEFNNALAIAENDDMQGAYERMLELAPIVDKNEATPESASSENMTDDASAEVLNVSEGFPPAHLWIAGALMKDEIELPDPGRRLHLVKLHAEAALGQESENLYAKYLVVQYYLETNQRDLAFELMEELVREYPELSGQLMSSYLAAGELSRARLKAARYVRHMRGRSVKDLDATQCLLWITALQLNREFEQAGELAREAAERFLENEDIQAAAREVVMAKLKVAESDSQIEVKLLHEAHTLDPGNQQVIDRLAQRWVEDPSLVQPHIDAMLQNGNGNIADAVFLKAGELYASRGDFTKAVEYCQLALQVNADCARAYNNIAWVRANIAPVDISEALRLVNLAIELEPDAEFFETRGQIHFKQHDIDSAIRDLERAVNGGLPAADLVNSHRTLARVYRERGFAEKADAHESRARSAARAANSERRIPSG